MKVIVDANLSPQWALRLREAGIEADHWSEIGRGDAPDREIIAVAERSGAVILTRDLDFGNWIALRGARKPSVVQLRADRVSPAAIGDRVIADLLALEQDLERGSVITIVLRRTRVTPLPLVKPLRE